MVPLKENTESSTPAGNHTAGSTASDPSNTPVQGTWPHNVGTDGKLILGPQDKNNDPANHIPGFADKQSDDKKKVKVEGEK
jgi:hypothetical protein